MVSVSIGSIFKRKDGRYFIYLPKNLVEDTSFPFPIKSPVKVKVRFIPGEKRLIVEE
ncbi:MAG: hypothetical protein L6N95_04830 [Candidatus Methylarchaceae archaeon HK01B]|nr:hypothetical protein [Candidatus Methylarchaceae archaeon HK01M]MCP8319135.1 hypothetical protein [Candidatus Methylarchaceae archaeon HK01B]